MIKIEYGIIGKLVDVTSIALLKLTKNSVIFIPSSDEARAKYFKDHLVGVLKTVFITTSFTEEPTTVECDHLSKAYIDIQMKQIYMNDDAPVNIQKYHITKQQLLSDIHAKYKLDYGSFQHEYPEQLMAATYLTGNEKVLDAHQAAEPGAGARTRLTSEESGRLVCTARSTCVSPRRWLRAKRGAYRLGAN